MLSKKMLALIKSEFYGLCAEFYSCELNLESINNSYITLVATINNPEGASSGAPGSAAAPVFYSKALVPPRQSISSLVHE